MVNSALSFAARGRERALALSYAPAYARPAVEALFALDTTLGAILQTTREPLVGQMRLTWWHEALRALDAAPAPAEPVLRALAGHVLPRGVSGEALAGIVDGWEALLADPPDLAMVGTARGEGLVRLAAQLTGSDDDRVGAAGRAWAWNDVALHLRDPLMADQARRLASEALEEVGTGQWRRGLRPLAALALLARSDLGGGTPGSPSRVGRLAMLRITGF